MTDHCSCPGCEPGDDCPLNELEKERDAAIDRAEKVETDVNRLWNVVDKLSKLKVMPTHPIFEKIKENSCDLDAIELVLGITTVSK